MNYYDPWKERTLQLKLAREDLAKAHRQEQGSPFAVALVIVGFIALYVAFMWLEAN